MEQKQAAPAGDGLAAAVSEAISFKGGRSARTPADAPSPTPAAADASIRDQLRGARSQTPFRLGGDHDDDDAVSDVGSEVGRIGVGEEAPGDGRSAPAIMARLKASYRSAPEYVRSIQFNNARAGHEARRTAQALDALIREGVPLHYEGMEILVRNLAGICEADRLGDPAILEGIEWAPPQAIIPRQMLRTVIKDANRHSKLRMPKKTKPPAASGPAPGAAAK